MRKNKIIPTTEGNRVIWAQNFGDKLPSVADKFDITPAEVKKNKDNIFAYVYWVNHANQLNEQAKLINAFKNELGFGDILPIAQPVAYNSPESPPPLTDGGIFKQISILISKIKKHPAYTKSDGEGLGIEPPAKSPLDAASIKPKLEVRLTTDGRPEILWIKGDYDGVEIQVKKGNGTWQFVAIDLKPDYTDMSQLPEIGTSEIWQYRIIYIDDSEHIGMWSDTFEIVVKGV